MDPSDGPSPVGLHRPAPAPPTEESPADTPGPVVDRPVGPPPSLALHLGGAFLRGEVANTIDV